MLPVVALGYNAMGQLNTMPGVVDSVPYGPAGELLAISGVYSESRTNNWRLQLTSDPVSGETISANSNQGWAQGFAYDGLAGSVPQLHVGFDATNRQWGLAYDANGNQLSDTTGANTLQYDIENRLIWAQAGASSLGNGYGYDPDSRRVYKSTWIPAGGTRSVGWRDPKVAEQLAKAFGTYDAMLSDSQSLLEKHLADRSMAVAARKALENTLRHFRATSASEWYLECFNKLLA